MSLTSADLIPLTVSSELPRAGCLYACRGLFHAADYGKAASPPAMRQAAGQAVIELAFQHFLSAQGIPFYQEAATPFTAPDHASLVLGGRLCQVTPILNNHPLGDSPASRQAYLQESRLPLPAECGLPGAHEDEELLIFAALSRQAEAENGVELDRPGSAEILVHALPAGWAQPKAWVDMGRLGVTSTAAGGLDLSLDGQDSLRQHQSERLALAGGVQQVIHPGLYALAALRAEQRPAGKVEIRRQGDRQAYTVSPHQWASLWNSRNQVTLLGYLSRGEARRMSSNLPGTHAALTRLHPLMDLFERLKQWGGTK
jgi:hypothetical protein